MNHMISGLWSVRRVQAVRLRCVQLWTSSSYHLVYNSYSQFSSQILTRTRTPDEEKKQRIRLVSTAIKPYQCQLYRDRARFIYLLEDLKPFSTLPKMAVTATEPKRPPLLTLLYVGLHYLAYRILRLFWAPSDSDRQEQPAAGKVVVITGGNGGLGLATAIEMGSRGASVVIGCRNLKQGQAAVSWAQRVTGSERVYLYHLDLSDLDSVREFAAKVGEKYPKIHILVNNAGIHDRSETLEFTKAGHETHLGVNHLGHFLLTNLLLPNLKKAAPSRVVSVSSSFQLLEELRMDDLNLKKNGLKSVWGKNNPNLTYANSKYANSLFTYELGYRLKDTGVTTYSLCPGIVTTQLHFKQQDNWNWSKRLGNYLKLTLLGFSPQQALETVLYCALSNHCKHETGLMYHFSKPFATCNRKYTREQSKELWEQSEKMVSGKMS